MPGVKPISEGFDALCGEIINSEPLGHIQHPKLDRALGGIRDYLCIIAGGPGTGKTTFVHEIADYWALTGHPVVFFEGELRTSGMLAKSITRLTKGGLSYSDMFASRLTGDRLKMFTDATEIYRKTIAPRMHILHQEMGLRTMGDCVKEVAHKFEEPPLVVVDYVQIVSLPQEFNSVDERIGLKFIASELRRMVDELHCPLMAISSINRVNYDKKTVGLDSLGGSSAFEYGADLVMPLIVRGDRADERATNMTVSKRPIIAAVVKNRYGACAKIDYTFDAPNARFIEAE